MTESQPRFKDAVIEASINGVVLFTFSAGTLITTKSAGYLNADASYEFIIVQSLGLAFLRFSTYMMKKDDRIEAAGLEELVGKSKGRSNILSKFASFCSRHKIGKLI